MEIKIVIVGLDNTRLDSALIADLEFAIEELNEDNGLEYSLKRYGIKDIKQALVDYIFNQNNINTQRFYFENNNIFIHYKVLDENFTKRFQEYCKQGGLQLVV